MKPGNALYYATIFPFQIAQSKQREQERNEREGGQHGLERELAVGGLDLLVGGVPGHAEHLVRVAPQRRRRRPLHLPR